MRGKAASVTVPLSGTGITPAYAGKREEGIQEHNHHEDHPRLCGEKQKPKKSAHIRGGITPAYAGKSGNRQPPHVQR